MDDRITKVSRTIRRDDGSFVKIVAYAATGQGMHISVGVYVLRRQSESHAWQLCNDSPHPDWRNMSVDDYIKFGRSEKLRAVTHGEIFKVASMVGKSMQSMVAAGEVIDKDAVYEYGTEYKANKTLYCIDLRDTAGAYKYFYKEEERREVLQTTAIERDAVVFDLDVPEDNYYDFVDCDRLVHQAIAEKLYSKGNDNCRIVKFDRSNKLDQIGVQSYGGDDIPFGSIG